MVQGFATLWEANQETLKLSTKFDSWFGCHRKDHKKPAFQEAVCNANAVFIGTIVPSARKELAHSQAKDTASYLSLVRTFAKGECKN